MTEHTTEHHDALIAHLADHDEACPVCAYNLRGVRTPVCPECSAELTLGVRAPRAIAGPWALALIAFALGLGFDAVTGLFFFVPVVMTRGEDPMAIAFFITLATLAACSGLGIGWMLTRRRVWMRMRTGTQWKLAWAIFFGVGILHALAGGALIAIVAL